MELGPHADDVRDIVDLVESGTIFRDPRPPTDGILIIESISNARYYNNIILKYNAYKGIGGDKENDGEDDDEDEWGWSWVELIEHGGELGSNLLRFEMPEKQKAVPGLAAKLSELIDGAIIQALQRQLGKHYTERDILYILGTIDWIVRFRATFGRTLPFIERLVEIYRLGGHPCGWIGRYPEGQLVAYFPPV